MKKNIGFLFVLILILGVAGGGYWWFGPKAQKQPTGPLQKVSLKLKWLHQSQFAGNYVAAEKGLYRNQGLEVEIKPFAFGENVIEDVVSGKSDVGIAGADEVMIARSKGIPVKAIGVIFKKTPVVAYSLKEKGIVKPADLIGKRLGLQVGNNIEYQYAAMLSSMKIDRKKITEVKIGHTADDLLSGRVDVATGYVINEPQQVVDLGKEVNNILVADFGVNIYADVFFTTEETIKNKPEMVQKFVTASIQGWQYAIEHEAETVGIVMKYATKSSLKHETYMLHASIPFVNTGVGHVGQMDKTIWMRINQILVNEKILKNDVNLDEVFTNQFVNRIYQ